jgi:hypothetical protein
MAAIFTASCGQGRGEAGVQFESRPDAAFACDRVEAALSASDEGERSVDLPAAAEAVVRTAGTGSATCGEKLLGWLTRELETRPLDVRPRLESRIVALGHFLLAREEWRKRAIDTFGRLLLDPGRPVLHQVENVTYLGPGSQSMSLGWVNVVSLAEMQRWVAFALAQESARRVYALGGRPNFDSDAAYRDLLIRYFTAGYTERPKSPSALTSLGPGGLSFDARAIPPAPEQLGRGQSPFDLLWVDLVEAFRAAPEDASWQALPPELRSQLVIATSDRTPATE